MKNVDQLTDQLFERTQDFKRSDANKKECLKLTIRAYAVDVLNPFKNISETSLDDQDKEQRIKALCEKTGLTYTNNTFY